MKNQQWRSEWQNGSGMPARRQMATEKTVTTTRAQHHGGHPTGPVLEASRGILPGWPMRMSLAHSSVAVWPPSPGDDSQVGSLEDGEHVWRAAGSRKNDRADVRYRDASRLAALDLPSLHGHSVKLHKSATRKRHDIAMRTTRQSGFGSVSVAHSLLAQQ